MSYSCSTACLLSASYGTILAIKRLPVAFSLHSRITPKRPLCDKEMQYLQSGEQNSIIYVFLVEQNCNIDYMFCVELRKNYTNTMMSKYYY